MTGDGKGKFFTFLLLLLVLIYWQKHIASLRSHLQKKSSDD
jgi:hypothetical protein